MKHKIPLGIITLLIVALFWYLFRPLTDHPQSAAFTTLGENDGAFQAFPRITGNIYGIGLSVAKHIEETAYEYDHEQDPVVFEKNPKSLIVEGGITPVPDISDLFAAIEKIEPGLEKIVQNKFPQMPALLDYEGELGFILLEDIDTHQLSRKDFAPELGFFVLDDISSRTIAVLGEGRDNRHDYWGLSKSFPAFLPVSGKIWVPKIRLANAIPDVMIETRLNGELRQRFSTSDMIYTPLTMLRAIKNKYPSRTLKKGDMVLMGTGGGVVFETPRWKARLGTLLRLDRFTKTEFFLKKKELFMKPGDTIVVSGEWLGTVHTDLK